MTYTIGLATTFHDPAIAIIGPDGAVLFAEATERYLQYKRAPNCEPDSAPRMEGLLKRYIPKDAEVRIATSWGEDFTGFLDQMARAGSFTLDALLKLSPELNRSLVPERTERAERGDRPERAERGERNGNGRPPVADQQQQQQQ